MLYVNVKLEKALEPRIMIPRKCLYILQYLAKISLKSLELLKQVTPMARYIVYIFVGLPAWIFCRICFK